MHCSAAVFVLDLFLTTFPGPASRESTFLPAPALRVPSAVFSALGLVTPTLSAEPIDPKVESTIRTARLRRFPRFRMVIDNPSEILPRRNIVVIVAGNPRERELWAESARTHFGMAAFIYNDVFSVAGLATVLERFPQGSVEVLAFGGHGEYCDGGVFMGIKDPPEKGRLLDRPEYHLFGEHINVENLMSTTNKTHRMTITRALARDSQVEFHVCIVGQERNLLNFAEAFQRRCWANPGDVGEWGEGQYPWFYKDPPRRR